MNLSGWHPTWGLACRSFIGNAIWLITLSASLTLAGTVAAQEETELEDVKRLLQETQESMQEMMQEYQRRVETLEKRIQGLEEQSEVVTEQQDELEEKLLEQEVAASEAPSGLFGNLSINGYYDFQFLAADNETSSSFVSNELSVFLRHESEDERLTFFSEIEFEVFDGDEFYFDSEDRTSEIEIETAWLEYKFLDSLRLRAGKLLLPQYWQTYHYPNLTLSTRPPAMVGAIFPSNIIGVQARGDIWLKNNRGVSYVVYVGNGGDSETTEIDRNNNKAVGGRVTLHLANGELFETFDVSASGYTGDNNDDESEDIHGFDAQIRIGNFELLSEYAIGNRTIITPNMAGGIFRVSDDSRGFYVQTAYNVAPKWHVYYRFDELERSGFTMDRFDLHQHTVGANFRPLANISLKLEGFRAYLEGDLEDFNGLAASVVYNF